MTPRPRLGNAAMASRRSASSTQIPTRPQTERDNLCRAHAVKLRLAQVPSSAMGRRCMAMRSVWSCRADLASPWRNVAALAPNRPDEVMAKGTNTRLPSADTPMLGEAPEARRLGVLSAELRMLAERSPVALASHRWTPGARSLRCSAATNRSWTGVSLRCAAAVVVAQLTLTMVTSRR